MKATSTLGRSSSEPGLFAWKQLGPQGLKPYKKEIKVEGNPNKFKNLSSVRIKSVGKEVKRYETSTASTFTQKKAEMINRRTSFNTSKVRFFIINSSPIHSMIHPCRIRLKNSCLHLGRGQIIG